MIIEKIVIKSFGLIRDMTLEFSETVNVIEGQNEAGKSTIAAFIKYMLYGFSDGEGEGDLSERKKRINWDTGVAEGSMYVKVKGKRYLISRMTSLTDNGARQTYKEESSIIDLETGAPAFGKLPAGEVFFGVRQDLFENTAFVGQIGDPRINEGSVKDSIENILFSGAETVNNKRAAAKITDKMENLLRSGGSGGAIVDLIRKREELEARLQASDTENKLILVKEAELHEIRMRKSGYEDKLARLRELDADYNNVMLIQAFDKLHELEEESDKRNEAYNAFVAEHAHDGFVPDRAYLTDIAVARRGVNDAYSTLRDAEEAYEREKSAIGITREVEGLIEMSDELGGEGTIRDRAKRLHGCVVRGAAFTILGAVFGVASAVAFLLGGGALEMVLAVALALLSVASIGYFAYSLVKNKKALSEVRAKFSTESYKDLLLKLEHIGEQRVKRDGMIKATECARDSVASARMSYESAKIEMANIILKWSAETPSQNLDGFLDSLEARVREFLDKKDALYHEKTEAEFTVKEARRNLADKSEIDVRAKVQPIRRKALVGVNHDDILDDIERHKKLIEEENEKATEAERLLETLKSRAGDPGELYSKIQAIESRIDVLSARHKACYIALKAIESASDNLRLEISPRLGSYATKMMGVMTDKKYKEFEVNDALTVSFSIDGSEQRSIDFLSGGTRDLAYIAVRMALVDMLYTERPPLIFDESFAHQDNARAKAMMKAITSLTKDGSQSFIFTCRNRESQLAKELNKKAGVFVISQNPDAIA